MFNAEQRNVSSRSCCSICASRSLSFPVSRIICFSAGRFPALANTKITATRPLSSSERWTPYSLSNPASAARVVRTVRGYRRANSSGRCYQYRWQTNCDLTPRRGGYKADRITPVHHKTNISQLTKMVYQTFDRLTQLFCPADAHPGSGSGTRNMEKKVVP